MAEDDYIGKQGFVELDNQEDEHKDDEVGSLIFAAQNEGTPAERISQIKDQYVQMCEEINTKVRTELDILEGSMISEKE